MPRKAPTNITEHRITFGQYERERLNELQNSISFAQYTSPLKSNVVAVIAAGGLGYLGLAYAFEWWPFEPSKGFFGTSPFFVKSRALASAMADCNLTPLIEQVNAEKLQEFEDAMATRKQFVADNPNPDSMSKRMEVNAMKALIAQENDLRQMVLEKNEERLQQAMKLDEKCAAKKADEQDTKWYDGNGN